jgi:uridine kinase
VSAFVIGIAGGSASGKSMIAARLRELLKPLRAQLISQDSYFRSADSLPCHAHPAASRTWPDHNHPDSFDSASLHRDLLRARSSGADVVIVEGILVLYPTQLRDLMDLKLYVHVDADERIVRRIRRDFARGADHDDICDFYLDSVRHRHRQFCQPTRGHADFIIPGGREERPEAERVLAQACERVRIALGRSRTAPASRPRAHRNAEDLR